MPQNIQINKFGPGHSLLIDSKIVIGWNTTSIIEGIAANRFILIPYFYKKNGGMTVSCAINKYIYLRKMFML